MSKITFRKLLPTDSPAYRAIRLECLKNFPQYFGTSYDEQIVLPKLAWEAFIESGDPNHFTVGAFDGDSLIGICSFNRDGRGKAKHIGEIVQMYVKPEYAGKKVGMRLIQTMIAEAFSDEGVEQLLLNVVTTNISANRVYEEAGFVEYGVLKNNFKHNGEYSDQRMMVLFRNSP